MRPHLAKKCVAFVKRETVFCVSLLLALLSCLFVPPSPAYFSYIDWNTLALLFSLMAVMRGLQDAGLFTAAANLFLKNIRTTRAMLLVLVFLPFLCSMVITNDVSLIVFVPFGLTLLRLTGQQRLLVPQVVLQTLAANLGSMLTPMGNPQNLYLYNRSGMGFGPFCGLMLPYVLAAAGCLALAVLFIRPAPVSHVPVPAGPENKRAALCYAGGFLLCLLGVFKALPPVAVAAGVAAALLVLDRRVLRSIDYPLLGTFFAFFIFVGNMVEIPGVPQLLSSVLEGRVVPVSVLASQAISNVPAALLLSGFTSRWQELIVGCNLGGLGTLIASMASLISYKMVVREDPRQRKRYFRSFTLFNLGFLALLLLLHALL